MRRPGAALAGILLAGCVTTAEPAAPACEAPNVTRAEGEVRLARGLGRVPPAYEMSEGERVVFLAVYNAHPPVSDHVADVIVVYTIGDGTVLAVALLNGCTVFATQMSLGYLMQMIGAAAS